VNIAGAHGGSGEPRNEILERVRSLPRNGSTAAADEDLLGLNSPALKVRLAEEIMREMLPATQDVDYDLMDLFGHRHGVSVGNNSLRLLGDHGDHLARLTDPLSPPPESDPVRSGSVILNPYEYCLLAIASLLHDVGFILAPSGQWEQRRSASLEFILANSTVMCLRDEEAALVASIANVVSFEDVAALQDWPDAEHPVRCRMLAAAFHLGNLVDLSWKRLPSDPRAPAWRLIPRSLWIPYATVVGARLERAAADRLILVIEYHAPNDRRNEVEERIRGFFEPRLAGADRLGLDTRADLRFAKSADRDQRRLIVSLLDRPQSLTGEITKTPDARVIAALRLLDIRSNYRSKLRMIRCSVQWLILNRVSPKQFLHWLEESGERESLLARGESLLARRSPLPKEVRRAQRGDHWDWTAIHDALRGNPDPDLVSRFCGVTVLLALHPGYYADSGEAGLGAVVATKSAALVASGVTASEGGALPILIAKPLLPIWIKPEFGPEWRNLAAEVILGPPTAFGRAGSSFGRFVALLLAAATDPEVPALATRLMPCLPRAGEGARETALRRLTAVATKQTDDRRDLAVQALATAGTLLAQLVPETDRDATFSRIMKAPLEQTWRRLVPDQKALLLDLLSRENLGQEAVSELFFLGLEGVLCPEAERSPDADTRLRRALPTLVPRMHPDQCIAAQEQLAKATALDRRRRL